MIYSNAHTHTTYCDGKNTVEEMILSAIQKKFHTLGFSGHSNLTFCDDYAMTLENTIVYRDKVKEMKEKYQDQIQVVLGLEWDYYSNSVEPSDYEYLIGSVHHLYGPYTNQYYALDNTMEEFDECLNQGYHGDFYAMAKDYFDHLIEMIQTKPIDIVGHIDLLKKLNKDECFFKEDDPIYLDLAKKAIDAGIEKGVIFEINTGGLYRGYHKEPYPGKVLLQYIAKQHGKVMINSDSHNIDSIDFYFEEAIEYAKEFGITEIYQLDGNHFRKELL